MPEIHDELPERIISHILAGEELNLRYAADDLLDLLPYDLYDVTRKELAIGLMGCLRAWLTHGSPDPAGHGQ